VSTSTCSSLPESELSHLQASTNFALANYAAILADPDGYEVASTQSPAQPHSVDWEAALLSPSKAPSSLLLQQQKQEQHRKASQQSTGTVVSGTASAPGTTPGGAIAAYAAAPILLLPAFASAAAPHWGQQFEGAAYMAGKGLLGMPPTHLVPPGRRQTIPWRRWPPCKKKTGGGLGLAGMATGSIPGFKTPAAISTCMQPVSPAAACRL
jgi:hypothetical protein